MCGFKEENQGESSQTIHNYHQGYQEQLFFQQMQHHHHQTTTDHHIYGGSSILPWPLPPVHSFNHFGSNNSVHNDPFLIPPPPPPAPSSSYGGLFNRRPPGLQFAYDGSSTDHHHLRILSDSLGVGPMVQPGSTPFGLHTTRKCTITDEEYRHNTDEMCR